MNKTELVECVALEANLTKKLASDAVNAVFDVMTRALEEGDAIRLAGFGSFSVKERAARKGRNPFTGEEITVPAKKSVSFKASKNLKW